MTKKGPIKVHEKNTKIQRKKQLSVRIPNGYVWEDFKKMVRDKYGGHEYSYVGMELEMAMKKHMRDHNIEGYQDINFGPTVAHTKLSSEYYVLMEYLEMMHEKGDVISYDELANVMVNECGRIDDRTHNKHIRLLVVKKILIKAGEDEDKLYYYKKVPDEIPNTIRVQKNLKDEHYSILVKNGLVNKEITINKLRKVLGQKNNEQAIIQKLEDKNLLINTGIGRWMVLDMNNVDEFSKKPQFDSEVTDYLTDLASAKPYKDRPGKIIRSPE